MRIEHLSSTTNGGAHDYMESPNSSEFEEESSEDVAPIPIHAQAEQLPKATAPPVVKEDATLDDPGLYFNKELSWLDFNWRVLFLAMDERLPILERVRFLSIASSNLDEFFRKRVGGLKRQIEANVRKLSPDGRTPSEQLTLIARAVPSLYKAMGAVWNNDLKPVLKDKAGVWIKKYSELTRDEKAHVNTYFEEQLFPILTPLAVDPGHPFPFISNLSLSLAVLLKHPEKDTEHFARLKVPLHRGRWIRVNDQHHYVAVEQVIAANAEELFRGMEIVGVYPFRVTRNADLDRNEEVAEDLIEMISEELQARKSAPIVRLEVQNDMPQEVRDLLRSELKLEPGDVYETMNGMVDHADCGDLANLDIPEHQYTRWEPVIPERIKQEGDAADVQDIFSIVKKGDILVHHPYESFNASTLHFIEEAAEDPQVLAIKQTIYRTSDTSPIIDALLKAADRGKIVAVLVEVKARFDEENNIEWVKKLEQSEVHVTYGVVGLKTHCKITLVVREEDGQLQTYCHIGTGNYNAKTARLYTDIGLLTADKEKGYDVINVFNSLTGRANEWTQEYRKLIVAPREMRSTFIEYIQQEIAFHELYGNGHVIAKMNALDDIDIIQELYRASQAGVRVELIVRGHCRLRPGIAGISENIRVISILGRFLEHSRVFYFHHNNDPKLFIGSADWMRRNLDDRVEVATEIEDAELRTQMFNVLKAALDDRQSAWELGINGRYSLWNQPQEEGQTAFQEVIMKRTVAQRSEG